MNKKRNLVGILASSAILAGCNSLEKNDDVLIGNYTFEREAIQYAEANYEGENRNPTIEEYLSLAERADENKDSHISKKELEDYVSAFMAFIGSQSPNR